MATFNSYYPASGYSTGFPSMPPPMPNSSGEPRLTYFITRHNGLPVPLIPADELPVTLESVPRVLSPNQTYGMHYVGNGGYPGVSFKLQSDAPGIQRSTSQPGGDSGHYRFHSADNTRQFQAPDALARQAFANNANTSSNTMASTMPKRPVSASQAAVSWRRSDPPLTSTTSASEATQNAINAILRSEAGAETAERIGYRPRDSTPPPSGIIPDQEKKVYCTFWILNGTCAYAQQGCRYKHEMPDKAKLAEIGIKHVPQWWKEENAAFKIGPGKMAIVGPIVKPEEWLNVRKGSDADSERSSSGETESTTLTSVSEKLEEEARKPAKKEIVKWANGHKHVQIVPTVPIHKGVMNPKEAKKTTFKDQGDTKDNLKAVDDSERGDGNKEAVKKFSAGTSPVVPPARPSTPVEEARKMSTGSDLIKFTPLVPSPPPSTKRITADAITSKARELSSTKTMKVFVPAGESPETHIADAKRRERATRSKTPSPVQTMKPSEKQGKEMPKGKAEGLAASRWAKTERIKAGCRPRRPASSSPACRAKAGEAAYKEAVKKEVVEKK